MNYSKLLAGIFLFSTAAHAMNLREWKELQIKDAAAARHDEHISYELRERDAATERLIAAAKGNNLQLVRNALKDGACVHGRAIQRESELELGHEPILEALTHDNVAIFKELAQSYDSITQWLWEAKIKNATNILAYIKEQKEIKR